jgi:hypothetical protein
MPTKPKVFFSKTINADVTLWRCKPDRKTTLTHLLDHIKSNPGGKFLLPKEKLDIRRMGNLGEFIALRVALAQGLPSTSPQLFASNAVAPLQPISTSGIDICYALFDAKDPSKDILWIQETKTTYGKDLSYGDRLIGDYSKLFGTDLNLTLQSRIQVMQSRLEIERGLPDLAERLGTLAETSASACTQIQLIPTLIHDENSHDPVVKLVGIRSAICSLGWTATQLVTWSIAIKDLEGALTELASGTVK